MRLSSGAEFIVVVCGSIMTMPGLPRVPAANNIKLNENAPPKGFGKNLLNCQTRF